MVQRSGEQQQRTFSEGGKQSPMDFSESPHAMGTSHLSEQRRRIAFPLKDLSSVIPGRVAFSLPPPAGLLRKEALRRGSKQHVVRPCGQHFYKAVCAAVPASYPGAGPAAPATPALAWLLALTAGPCCIPEGPCAFKHSSST